MENKKIIYIVIIVLVLAAGYWFYKKSKTASPTTGQNAVAEEKTKEVAIVERKIEVEAKLSQFDKDDVYALAVRLYNDMDGINLHNMDLFDKLYKYPDDKFFYLITEAYPQVDSWGFMKRFNKQNFKRLKLFSKWTDAKAVQLENNIRKRIENFKI